MQTKTEIQRLLAGAGVEPNKRLGQHFLIDLQAWGLCQVGLLWEVWLYLQLFGAKDKPRNIAIAGLVSSAELGNAET